jgi:hypothetical protein
VENAKGQKNRDTDKGIGQALTECADINFEANNEGGKNQGKENQSQAKQIGKTACWGRGWNCLGGLKVGVYHNLLVTKRAYLCPG